MISVVLVTYTSADLLASCLGSLVAATRDIEVVIVDNTLGRRKHQSGLGRCSRCCCRKELHQRRIRDRSEGWNRGNRRRSALLA